MGCSGEHHHCANTPDSTMNIDQTQNLHLQLPHPSNHLEDDIFRLRNSLIEIDAVLYGMQSSSDKNASSGYPGLTQFKINLKNLLGDVTGFIATESTAQHTWMLPDKTGTIALLSDIPAVESWSELTGNGFSCTPSGGTASQPALLTYSKGTERMKAALTWGAAGGAAGNVAAVAYSHSSDSGVSYSAIGTKTITYDASANVTSTTWS